MYIWFWPNLIIYISREQWWGCRSVALARDPTYAQYVTVCVVWFLLKALRIHHVCVVLANSTYVCNALCVTMYAIALADSIVCIHRMCVILAGQPCIYMHSTWLYVRYVWSLLIVSCVHTVCVWFWPTLHTRYIKRLFLFLFSKFTTSIPYWSVRGRSIELISQTVSSILDRWVGNYIFPGIAGLSITNSVVWCHNFEALWDEKIIDPISTSLSFILLNCG